MRRVVKVGGSLFVRRDLATALPAWIAAQSQAETIVIVGGGALVDAVRQIDQIHPGDPVKTHWRAIDLLQHTFEMCAELFDKWPRISDSGTLQRQQTQGFSTDNPTLVAVAAFLDRETRFDIPEDWRTTSDTIAAILAIRLGADELVLLKSCDVDPGSCVDEFAKQGMVDAALPSLARRLNRLRVEQLP